MGASVFPVRIPVSWASSSLGADDSRSSSIASMDVTMDCTRAASCGSISERNRIPSEALTRFHFRTDQRLIDPAAGWPTGPRRAAC
ncbi:Uncharacterised protein [Mycobacteroides abscessus subsp. abscessus]|nr:Uncharacterised protein [Mycobacteroides abscessus subsp. abscessus]